MRTIDKLIENFNLANEEECSFVNACGGPKKTKSLLNRVIRNKEEVDIYDIIALEEATEYGIDIYSLSSEEALEEYIYNIRKEYIED
jgi:hypothetical protein